MSFHDEIAEFTAAEIVDALGCKRQTAYSWLDRSRKPPEWQHRHWLALIRSHQKKQPNKSQIPMTTRSF